MIEKETNPNLNIEAAVPDEENDIKYAPNMGRSYEIVAMTQNSKVYIQRVDIKVEFEGQTEKEILKHKN